MYILEYKYITLYYIIVWLSKSLKIIFFLGCMAEIRQQGNPGHPQPHGDQQPPDDRVTQRGQHLEAAHQGRAEE